MFRSAVVGLWELGLARCLCTPCLGCPLLQRAVNAKCGAVGTEELPKDLTGALGCVGAPGLGSGAATSAWSCAEGAMPKGRWKQLSSGFNL